MPTPEVLDFAPAPPVLTPGCVGANSTAFGMPSIDPEVNLRRSAKQSLVRWMDRRFRDDCDADTARTKAKLIGELLHTFLYDHQIYFDKRKVGDPAWGGNDITRLCVEADAGDADAKEEVIKLQSYLMSEGVEADDVVAVISKHRRCDIGIAGQRTKKAKNGSESNASNVGEFGGDDAFHDDEAVDMDAEMPTQHTRDAPVRRAGNADVSRIAQAGNLVWEEFWRLVNKATPNTPTPPLPKVNPTRRRTRRCGSNAALLESSINDWSDVEERCFSLSRLCDGCHKPFTEKMPGVKYFDQLPWRCLCGDCDADAQRRHPMKTLALEFGPNGTSWRRTDVVIRPETCGYCDEAIKPDAPVVRCIDGIVQYLGPLCREERVRCCCVRCPTCEELVSPTCADAALRGLWLTDGDVNRYQKDKRGSRKLEVNVHGTTALCFAEVLGLALLTRERVFAHAPFDRSSLARVVTAQDCGLPTLPITPNRATSLSAAMFLYGMAAEHTRNKVVRPPGFATCLICTSLPNDAARQGGTFSLSVDGATCCKNWRRNYRETGLSHILRTPELLQSTEAVEQALEKAKRSNQQSVQPLLDGPALTAPMTSTCCGEHERTFTAIGPIVPEVNSISNSATVVVALCGHGSIPYDAVALGKTENFTIIDLVVHSPMRHATFRPRAITDDLFAGKVDGTRVVLGFDCGCRSKINLVERYKAQNNGELPIYNVETVVGEFHGGQHKPSCYVHNSQFNVNYTALEQLDGVEAFYSKLRCHSNNFKSMSDDNVRAYTGLICSATNREKHDASVTTLRTKFQNAKTKLMNNGQEYEALKQAYGFSDADIPSWRLEVQTRALADHAGAGFFDPFSRLAWTCQAAEGASKYVSQQGEADEWHKAMHPTKFNNFGSKGLDYFTRFLARIDHEAATIRSKLRKECLADVILQREPPCRHLPLSASVRAHFHARSPSLPSHFACFRCQRCSRHGSGGNRSNSHRHHGSGRRCTGKRLRRGNHCSRSRRCAV